MTVKSWPLADTPHSRTQARLGQAYIGLTTLLSNPLAVVGLVIIGTVWIDQMRNSKR